MANEAQLELLGSTLLDANGDIISGGKLNTYETGTSTPLATYQDDALSTPHANPILTDSEGRFPVPIYMERQAYKLVLTDENDVVIDTIDPYNPTTFIIEQLASNKRNFSIDNQGVLTNSQEIYELLIPGAPTLKLPAGANDSRADADTAATAENIITIYKNGASIGTITFAISGTSGTWSVASDVTFAAGDRLRFVNQASADATLADVRITVVLEVV